MDNPASLSARPELRDSQLPIGGDTEKIQFFLGRAGLREYSHSKDLVYAVLKTVGFNKKFVDGVQLRARTD